jgi:hypothetical protein
VDRPEILGLEAASDLKPKAAAAIGQRLRKAGLRRKRRLPRPQRKSGQREGRPQQSTLHVWKTRGTSPSNGYKPPAERLICGADEEIGRSPDDHALVEWHGLVRSSFRVRLEVLMKKLLLLFLLPAAALLAPGSALATGDSTVAGTGQGAEHNLGNGTYKFSGNWSTGVFLGMHGTYNGTFTFSGEHRDCLSAYADIVPDYVCPVDEINCSSISGGVLTITGSSVLSSMGTTVRIIFDDGAWGDYNSGVCRPPLPGNPRYVHLDTTSYESPGDVGDLMVAAFGYFEASSVSPAWTVPGGPVWIDQVNFKISSFIPSYY